MEDVPEHRPGWHDQHDDHRYHNKDNRLVAAPQVKCRNHERQARQQLVDGSEEWPENQATRAWSEFSSGDHGDQTTQADGQGGRSVLVRQGRDAKRPGQLLQDVTLQSRRGVECCGGKTGHQYGDQTDAKFQRQAQCGQEICATLNERPHLGPQLEGTPTPLGIVSSSPGRLAGELSL